MSSPKAVIISDIHFTPATLELASKALQMAQERALELNVPLIIAGDTLDSKAIMRGECVNRLIELFTSSPQPETYVLVGNHDLLNEKGTEHSLMFLRPYVKVIDKPTYLFNFPALIPYQSNLETLQNALNEAKRRGHDTIICHQGVQTAYMGHYAQDKTSLPPEAFEDFRTISGHYHRAQDIKCGRPRAGAIGLFSYVGNPYSLNFGEANDGPKGFQVLYDNGQLALVPTNLRKHVVIDTTFDIFGTPSALAYVGESDMLWLKVRGPKSQLDNFNKEREGLRLFGTSNYKLELIPTEADTIQEEKLVNMSEFDIFDSIIDSTADSDKYKNYLKALWREVVREDT